MSEQQWLEEMHQAGLKPGVTIRSYDFPTSNNCYIEGLLIKIAPAPTDVCPCSYNHLWIFSTDAWDTCNTCEGKGTTTIVSVQTETGKTKEGIRTCDRCNGEGSIVEKERLGRMYYPPIENMKIRGHPERGLGPGFVLVGYKDYVPISLNNPLALAPYNEPAYRRSRRRTLRLDWTQRLREANV